MYPSLVPTDKGFSLNMTFLWITLLLFSHSSLLISHFYLYHLRAKILVTTYNHERVGVRFVRDLGDENTCPHLADVSH